LTELDVRRDTGALNDNYLKSGMPLMRQTVGVETLCCRFLINSRSRRVLDSVECLKNNNEKLHFYSFVLQLYVLQFHAL